MDGCLFGDAAAISWFFLREAIGPVMQKIRLVCFAYCLFLTLLLLAPDPMTLLGIDRLPTPDRGRGLHFAVFVLLALVVHASRLRVRRGLVTFLLLAYAFLTECLQGVVPSRSVEFLDLLENLLGLSAGTAIWLLVRTGREKGAEASGTESAPSDQTMYQKEISSSGEAPVVESSSTTG